MKDNQNYIISLCRAISARGQQPTVGKIKSLSTRPLPIPDIITVLKKIKVNPDVLNAAIEDVSEAPPTEDSNQADLLKRVEVLERQVALLMEKIALDDNKG